MVSLANRRSVMTLFSGRVDVYSHQVRMVLSEKSITADIVDVDPATSTGRIVRRETGRQVCSQVTGADSCRQGDNTSNALVIRPSHGAAKLG